MKRLLTWFAVELDFRRAQLPVNNRPVASTESVQYVLIRGYQHFTHNIEWLADRYTHYDDWCTQLHEARSRSQRLILTNHSIALIKVREGREGEGERERSVLDPGFHAVSSVVST